MTGRLLSCSARDLVPAAGSGSPRPGAARIVNVAKPPGQAQEPSASWRSRRRSRCGLPKAALACGTSACTPVGQMIQPCADSAGQWRLAQCPHRKSSPLRSTRYDARTAGPHRSHVWFISCLPAFGCTAPVSPIPSLGHRAWAALLVAYGPAWPPHSRPTPSDQVSAASPLALPANAEWVQVSSAGRRR